MDLGYISGTFWDERENGGGLFLFLCLLSTIVQSNRNSKRTHVFLIRWQSERIRARVAHRTQSVVIVVVVVDDTLLRAAGRGRRRSMRRITLVSTGTAVGRLERRCSRSDEWRANRVNGITARGRVDKWRVEETDWWMIGRGRIQTRDWRSWRGRIGIW